MKKEYAEIVKLYNSMIGAHQLWELWQDSMVMFAICISNSIDKRFAEKRKQTYLEIVHKYSKNEIDIFVKIFAEIVNQLDSNPEQDFLGDLYMNLDLGSHWHGQFFTPYTICEMTAGLTYTEEITSENAAPVSICDCACGGGALLIAGAHKYSKQFQSIGLNGHDYIMICAQDISQVTAMMCYIQISLLGFAGKIKIGDSLLHPLLDTDNGSDIWYTPMYFSEIWEGRRLAAKLDNLMSRGKINERRADQ